jgi:hypothetical protein
MWKDPIVVETRALRDEYAKQFAYDGNAIIADILRRQALAGKSLVAFPPRKPAIVERSVS